MDDNDDESIVSPLRVGDTIRFLCPSCAKLRREAVYLTKIHKNKKSGEFTSLACIVDDHKVDHLRETYKEQYCFYFKKKFNSTSKYFKRYIEKYDFIQQIN